MKILGKLLATVHHVLKHSISFYFLRDLKFKISDIDTRLSSFHAANDVTPPVITGCPLNAISVTAPSGSNFATAIWTEPTATDNSGVAPTRSRSHAPGSSFPVGTTVVTYRFTDGSGNSDTCQFQVVVNSKYYILM